jgi:hypothetical protein
MCKTVDGNVFIHWSYEVHVGDFLNAGRGEGA